jgi:hypothetical protein
MDEVRVYWRKLHSEELHNCYQAGNIIWVIKSRNVKCAVNVPRMGEKRIACRVLVRKLEGKI